MKWVAITYFSMNQLIFFFPFYFKMLQICDYSTLISTVVRDQNFPVKSLCFKRLSGFVCIYIYILKYNFFFFRIFFFIHHHTVWVWKTISVEVYGSKTAKLGSRSDKLNVFHGLHVIFLCYSYKQKLDFNNLSVIFSLQMLLKRLCPFEQCIWILASYFISIHGSLATKDSWIGPVHFCLS